MLFEMIMGSIAPYPFLDKWRYVEYVVGYDVTIEYEVNDILLYFMFFRIYLPCRFVFYLTEFMNPRTQRVCQIYSCEADSMFALKALMKQKPYSILLGALAITIVMFGYHLRIFEGPISDASG
jgi:hypothetical protein